MERLGPSLASLTLEREILAAKKQDIEVHDSRFPFQLRDFNGI